jgi:hypothetical protein
MTDCMRLKRYYYPNLFTLINACIMMLFASHLFAATLHMGQHSVMLIPGQTIEVPVYSAKPISSDLTAKGRFALGDVSFTPSPGCHLSSNGCSLLITAAPNSQNYTAVPVVLSESGTSNKHVFFLSVLAPGEPTPANIKLPRVVSTPLILSNQLGSEQTLTFTNSTPSPLNNLTAVQLPIGVGSSICPTVEPGETCTLKLVVNDAVETGDAVISIQHDQGVLHDRILSIKTPNVVTQKPLALPSPKPSITLTAGNLSAITIPHTLGSTFYTSSSNGPVYQMIQVTNNGSSPVTLNTPSIGGTDPLFFSIDTDSFHYGGTPTFCNNTPTLANGASCVIMISSTVGYPGASPSTATLTISDGVSGDTLTFGLTDTTYVYAAGGFNTLGSATVSDGNLLAQCTAGTCSNALQGTDNNYASQNFGVGKWINALAITPTGNLIVGGVFGAIGGATSGSTGTSAALLAQCIPGPVVGNACFNQITNTNPYVLNKPYIDAITAPFLISPNKYMAVGGDFNQIKNTSASSGGILLAKCQYTGVTSTSNCNSYIGNKSANKAIAALNTLGSLPNSPLVNTGGLFTQIAGSSEPSSGTTFGKCTTSTCNEGMASNNNPNNSILGMSDDGTYLYMGGTFTQIGGYSDSSGGYPLVRCVPGSTTTCSKALTGSSDANGYIEGIVYSRADSLRLRIYVGGNFTAIGGATPLSGGKMLAACIPDGGCSNFITGENPYATGTDWGGGIFALAIGNQTTITG